MSDTRPPALPPSDEPAPKAKTLTFGQHLFIWAMVIIVGVLFGMGSSVSLLQHGPRSIQGVSENEVLQRQDIARRLQNALNPRRMYRELMFEHQSQDWYAHDILRARYADALGLMPEGDDLDRITTEWLAAPMPGQLGRTIRDVLAEHQGGRDEVPYTALRRYLAERAAIAALVARHVSVPAIPPLVAEDLLVMGERAVVDEVALSASHLLQPVKDDDAEIQTAYDQLRRERFAAPAVATVSVAWPDLAALGKDEAVSATQAQVWYDGHKERFRKAADPQAAALAAAEYRPLAEVQDEVAAAVRRERAEPKARQMLQAFADRLDRIENPDAAAFAKEAAAAGLVVTAGLDVPEARGGQLDLGALGSIKDQIGLFSSSVEPGFISSPLNLPGNERTVGIVVRVESRRPAGFRPLEQVKPEVMTWIAGRRAWKALLEQAEAVRVQAEKTGPGGLAARAASPAAAPWKANLDSRPMSPTVDLQPPAADPAGTPGEPRALGSLALPSRPVMVVAADGSTDVPQVRLVQVREIKPADALPDEQRRQFAGQYRQVLAGFRGQLFDEELRRKVGK
jgi:hypothetical protein